MTAVDSEPEKLLQPETVAVWLDIAEQTLREWRMHGKGPTFIRVGGQVRYRREAVEAWLKSRTVEQSTDA